MRRSRYRNAGSLSAPTDRKGAAWLPGDRPRESAPATSARAQRNPAALRGYEQGLRIRVLPDLGGHRLTDIARRDLQALVGRMQAAGLDPSTIRNALAPLRAIYRHRVDDVPVNPTAGVRLPAVRG